MAFAVGFVVGFAVGLPVPLPVAFAALASWPLVVPLAATATAELAGSAAETLGAVEPAFAWVFLLSTDDITGNDAKMFTNKSCKYWKPFAACCRCTQIIWDGKRRNWFRCSIPKQTRLNEFKNCLTDHVVNVACIII